MKPEPIRTTHFVAFDDHIKFMKSGSSNTWYVRAVCGRSIYYINGETLIHLDDFSWIWDSVTCEDCKKTSEYSMHLLRELRDIRDYGE